jgi:hypothetical protein
MSDVVKKRALRIAAAVGAALVATVIILLASPTGKGASKTDASSANQVKLELRGKPVAEIHMNGKKIGTTPKTVVVPRGKTPIQFEAIFMVEKYGVARPAKKVETWRQTKQVVPDAEQSVDFTIEDATKIEEGVETPERTR